jgi:hypothetical protein
MSKSRTVLTEEERARLDSLKEAIQEVILDLTRADVRLANIEIELSHFIKKLLKGD